MHPGVDRYLAVGCGRCPLVGTPECKVHNWDEELKYLRALLLDCGLSETLKWGMPCYTLADSNIVLLTAFKEYCALSFFKGALLRDPQRILVQQTENTQAARQIRFTALAQVVALDPVLRAYLAEAIAVEQAGLKVDFKAKHELTLPEELEAQFEAVPALKTAFEALTPGRQRAYVLHFSAPKQAKTRAARVEKLTQQILDGKGLNE